MLWGGQEARRLPWAHLDHGALGSGLVRGGPQTPPTSGPFYSPRGWRREPWALRKVPGLATGPSAVSSQVLGRDLGVPERQKMLQVFPTLQMFCPQQDPWQGRQPLLPHPAGRRSLNSGLRKVFVRFVMQDPTEPPAQREHRGQGRPQRSAQGGPTWPLAWPPSLTLRAGLLRMGGGLESVEGGPGWLPPGQLPGRAPSSCCGSRRRCQCEAVGGTRGGRWWPGEAQSCRGRARRIHVSRPAAV